MADDEIAPTSCRMENLSPSDMLKLLEDEAERLCQIEQKILNQLHHLQVEESVYAQAMKQLEAEGAAVKNYCENEEEDDDEADSMHFAEIDRELEEAMKATLEADNLLHSRDLKSSAAAVAGAEAEPVSSSQTETRVEEDPTATTTT